MGFFRQVLFLSLALVPWAIAAGSVTAGEPGEGRVVATVNGTTITAAQLDPAVAAAVAKYRKTGFRVVSDSFRQRIRRQELDKLIDMELLAQAGAATTGKEIEPAIVARVQTLRDALQKAGHPAAAESATLYEAAKRDVLVDAYLRQAGISSLQVPESELKNYYEANLNSFREPESVKVRHILLKLAPTASTEEVAQAEKRINDLRAKVAGGSDFAELARQNSQCASASRGGDLGQIRRGFMPAAFDVAVAELKPGEMGVVRTEFGIHLVQVIERTPETLKSYDQVKEFIAQYLLKDYQRKKTAELIDKLKQKARILITLD